jgi:hypothetical protein
MPEFEVSAMRNSLTVTIIAIAMLSSPLAYGQMPSAKPSGPTAAGSAQTLAAPKLPVVAPPEDALKNLAGGGYADPNYAPPGTHSKKARLHRVVHGNRTRWASSLFVGYHSYKAFPYCDCEGWYVPILP